VIESVRAESLPLPPEQVFDFVAEPANQPRWNTEVSNFVVVTDGPPGVGTRMTGDYNPIGRIDTEITVYERPSRLVFSSTGGSADMTVEFQFVPEGEGTLMTLSGSVSLKGALRFMEGAVRGAVAQQFEARARNIKDSLG
jgi:uncharacterized protein YndB with AHSA1/START domain